MQFNIKLLEIKQSIDIPTFKRDDLLIIALTDPSTLDRPDISVYERENRKKQYRQLAILGDALFDAVLIDYLLSVNSNLTQENIDKLRKDIATRESLSKFAIELGLPEFSSSWDKKNRKPPKEEPGVWGEMFEAVIGTIFLDLNRDFDRLSSWLCDRFIRPAIGNNVGDPDAEDLRGEAWWDDIAPTYMPGKNDD